MDKRDKHKKKTKKPSWFARIYRFFVPQDFKTQLYQGMKAGEDIRRGKISPKIIPTYWLGKGVRRMVDPKHKMRVGKQEEK